jgi:hypothetical protein
MSKLQVTSLKHEGSSTDNITLGADGSTTISGDLTVQGTTITVDNAAAQNLTFGDNDMMRFGNSNDLSIYHNGSNSIIQDTGTGELQLLGSNLSIRSWDAAESYIDCVDNSYVQIRHDNSVKFKTEATGINVSGQITGGNENLPTVKPALNLNFINSKALDPRISFYRNNIATYYDGKSRVKMSENRAGNGKSPGDTGWSRSNVTVVSGVADPFGGNDAVTNTFGTSTAFTYDQSTDGSYTSRAGEQLTVSVWAKGDGSTNFKFYNFSSTQENSSVYTPTTSWVRYSWTYTPGTNGANGIGYMCGGTTGSIDFWGFQIEAAPYPGHHLINDSNRPKALYIPKLITAGINEPRFDHDPDTGESKGLLIEGQKTNILSTSTVTEQASSADFWTKAASHQVPVPGSMGMAPDGTYTAPIFYSTDDDTYFYTDGNISYTAGATYCASAWVWCAPGTNTAFFYNDGSWTSFSPVAIDGGAIDRGEWVRVYGTFVPATTTAVGQFRIDPGNGDDGVNKFVSVWGLQVENGSYPTSYIPTSGAIATRSSDIARIEGTNFTDFYNFDEGTFIVKRQSDRVRTETSSEEVRAVGVARLDTTSGYGPQMNIRYYSSNSLANYDANGRQTDASDAFDLSESLSLGRGSLTTQALGYANDDFVHIVNGGYASSDDGGEAPDNVDTFLIGCLSAYSAYGTQHLKEIKYYNQRLSNTVITSLTEE